jgi:proteasome lid subunit RPN8/RPN11
VPQEISPTLVLPAGGRREMLNHVRASPDQEVCGLLGGEGDLVRLVFPVENQLHSAVRFRMRPEAQWQAMRRIETAGLQLIGIYHSHPAGPAEPSATDISESAYPGVVHVIWSPDPPGWACRGGLIEGRGWREIEIIDFELDSRRDQILIPPGRKVAPKEAG